MISLRVSAKEVGLLIDGLYKIAEESASEQLGKLYALRNYLQNELRAQASTDGAKVLLAKIRLGEIGNPFVVRDVYSKGWRNLSTPQDAIDAIRKLIDLDLLKEEIHKSHNKPKVFFCANFIVEVDK